MLRHLLATALAALLGATQAPSPQPARSVNLMGTVVVVNQQSDSITLIDLKRMEAYRHVAVVGGPHEAAVSPDGRSVLVTKYNKQGVGQQKTLSLIALPSGDTIKTIDLGEYRAPHDVRWVDATHVVVTAEGSQALLLVNVESGAVERVFKKESWLPTPLSGPGSGRRARLGVPGLRSRPPQRSEEGRRSPQT